MAGNNASSKTGNGEKEVDSIADVVDGIEVLAGSEDEVSVRDVLSEFGDRSFMPFMLILALIGITPVGAIPSVPTFLGLCIALVAAQFAFGRKHVWLPGFIADRSVNSDKLAKGTDKVGSVADKLDDLTKPRLEWLTRGTSRRVAGGIILVLCICLPVLELVPFAAAGPFLAIAILSLALMVRDGLVLLIGGVLALGALGYGIGWFAF
ncbi:MAG: exopolysaccharide biosynthesis protein [Erythrobacter sp.]|jgi:hypothetical protein|nr:exopolysaccharide biosynthesis protein [Erythrobacter sp.]